MKRSVSSAIAVSAILGAALLATASAHAMVLPPGGAGPPDVFAGLDPPETLVAQIVNGTITSNLPHDFTGTYSEAVFKNSTTGDLTFLIQVSNSSSSENAMVRFTASSFKGFITDVGVLTGSPPSGAPFTSNPTNAPTIVSRSASGSNIGFNYGTLGNPLAPGTTTQILAIETNATAFTAGNLSIINTGIDRVPSFAPAPIPIPGTLAMFATGLGFLGLTAVRKRKAKEQSLLV